MANYRQLCTIYLIVCAFSACTRQAPQLPSNKIVVVDTAQQAMLTINQELAQKEDSLLEDYIAKRNDKKFLKNPLGFWYKIEQQGNGGKIEEQTSCSFTYRMQLMDGKQVEQGRKQITIGKKEIIPGLEEGIMTIQRGDSAVFIIPWYLAYGLQGYKSKVPAYTSVIYTIRVEKQP